MLISSQNIASLFHNRDMKANLGWYLLGVAIIWGTSLAVATLWVAQGGIDTTVAGGAGALTAVGNLIGLAAANLLLYQVLLMARVPIFERGFGRDTITRLHRLTGFWSFWLFLAHIVLVVLGYSLTDSQNVFVQFWEMTVEYPGMLLSVVATLLLIAVVVLSVRRARRKVRYESWHLIHLYAYLGVGLAIPHQLWTGSDFLASPLATAYWWGLWIAAAACTVIFRLWLPLYRSWRSQLRVKTVTPDGAHAVTIGMTGKRLSKLHAQAGQFFVWRFLDGPGWSRGHPISLSARPTNQQLTITAKVVGDGTERMATLSPNTRVMIEGPYGTLTGKQRQAQKLLLVGAGAGVAPLVSILQEQQYEVGEATLITRDSNEEEAVLAPAIATLRDTRGVRHVPLTGSRTRISSPWLPQPYEKWDGAQLIQYLTPDIWNYDVFLCGPPRWMRSVQADLKRLGIRKDRIHTESFGL